MVDVYIRNVDATVYRQLKVNAAMGGITISEELKRWANNQDQGKKGIVAWAAGKKFKLRKEDVEKTIDLDEVIGEVVSNDYPGYKRPSR